MAPKIFCHIDDFLAEDGGLLHVLPLAVHLKDFLYRQVGWTILIYFFEQPLLHAGLIIICGWVGWVGWVVLGGV